MVYSFDKIRFNYEHSRCLEGSLLGSQVKYSAISALKVWAPAGSEASPRASSVIPATPTITRNQVFDYLGTVAAQTVQFWSLQLSIQYSMLSKL